MQRDEILKLLTSSLKEQLDQLLAVNHCGAGSIMGSVGRTEIRARISSVDRLACEAELISCTDPSFNAMPIEEMQKIGDNLAERLSYLEERLIVLETDPCAKQVQLRSEAPRDEARRRTYFEIQIGKSGVTLQRFSKQPEAQRVPIPAAFTRDVFTRVCADLVGAIQNEK